MHSGAEHDGLVRAVTEQVMRCLREQPQPKRILVLGKDPHCPIAACLRQSFDTDVQADLQQAGDYDFVVVPTWYLDRLRGKATAENSDPRKSGGVLDLREHRLLHERELRERCTADVQVLRLGKRTIVTALAADFIKRRGWKMERE